MITASFQLGLFLWYFISLYLIATDDTLSFQLKVTCEIINLLCIGFIGTNIFDKYVATKLYYMVAMILIAWYIYFTPQDFNNSGYSLKEKIIYVGIDLATLFYLFGSLMLSYSNSIYNKLNALDKLLRMHGFLIKVAKWICLR